MRHTGKKTLLRFVVGIYMVLLATASLLHSGPNVPLHWDSSITPTMQYMGRLLAYGVLSILVLKLAKASRTLSISRVALVFLGCCIYGVLLEAARFFVPGRTYSISDAVANGIGAGVGIVLWGAFGGFRKPMALPLSERPQDAGKTRVCMLVTNDVVDDPRVLFEAESLAQAGYQVTVIGWDRTSDSNHILEHRGVQIVQLAIRSTHGRGLTQPFFLAGFWLQSMKVLRHVRPQVIHCHDLDTLPLGYWAAKRLRAKLVFDAHENFPDMMVGHLPVPAVGVLRWVERWLVPKCDTVITVGELLAEFYRSVRARKVVVVGNWKDPADFAFQQDVIDQTRQELGLQNGEVAICYIANLGRERRIAPLLQAVSGNHKFACVIGGTGLQAELVRKYAQENNNIIYLGRVPPSDVPRFTAACDIVYYGFDETNPNAKWSAPNKLFEAIAAGKAILTGHFGEIGKIVRVSGCGVLADTRTRVGIASALESLTAPGALLDMKQASVTIQGRLSRSHAQERLTEAYMTVLCER